MNPFTIVDLVKEPSQAPQRVAEVLVLREVDLLFLERPDIRYHSVHAFLLAPAWIPRSGAASMLSTPTEPFGPGSSAHKPAIGGDVAFPTGRPTRSSARCSRPVADSAATPTTA